MLRCVRVRIGRKPERFAGSGRYHAPVSLRTLPAPMPLIRLLTLLALLFAANLAAAAADPKSDEFWYGSAADGTPVVRLYYFYSPTCPHCQAAAPYIDELRARWPWLEVQKYAVKDNRANATTRPRCPSAPRRSRCRASSSAGRC